MESYDAVIVGSGATGGWAAKELTEGGLRVALLEAGPLFPVEGDSLAPVAIDTAERQPIQSRCHALTDHTSHLFVDDLDNPYSFPERKPYHWIRSRQVGGRLHVWGRMAPRMSDNEFKAATRHGVGEDWPLSYADLAPYYERVERFLGVYGTPEQLPHMPDGVFLDPPRMTSGEQALKAAIEDRWPTRRVTSARLARRSPDAMLGAALRTGRLTLLPNSIASRVLSNARSGKATGVAYVDRVTLREQEVNARIVVLCASTIESTRLLLNSPTRAQPEGLGNSSGVLGHYLMDHTYGISFEGIAPQRPRREDEKVSHGALVPAFRNVTEQDVDFVGGYGLELQVSPLVGGRPRRLRNPFQPWGAWYWVSAFGQVMPTYENQVSLDPERTDAWGIPAVHIACSYGENEQRMAADQFRCITDMLEAANFHISKASDELAAPGLSSHEVGTARMGNDPSRSALNPHNQSWDVSNLFVTDGSCFPSIGSQNPTLTMMALTVRACDYIIESLRRGAL